MKLVKTSEQVNRAFVDGKKQDTVTGATFEIKDGDQTIGSAQTYPYGYQPVNQRQRRECRSSRGGSEEGSRD